MLDTTPKVRRDIIIACCLFLSIVIVGTVAFELYTQHEESVGTTIPTNAITGNVIGITGAPTAGANEEEQIQNQEKQIGVYRVVPSFSFVDEYNIVEEYDALQKKIRDFHKAVEECKLKDSLNKCLEETLERSEYTSWLKEEDCESTEEALFYDVTETFSKCLQSDDVDCLCVGILHPEKYAPGEYTMPVYQDGNAVLFTLLSTNLRLVLPEMSFAIEGQPMNYDEYTTHVEKESALGGFSSLEPSSYVYIYKQDAATLSVESQSTFSTYQTTREYCTLPQQSVYKFCVQSNTNVPTYDPYDGTTTEQPLVYLFAISFS